MKRSEMEYQLNNLLMDRLSEWAFANNGKVPLVNEVMEDIAQHVLYHIERAGMLPPVTEESKELYTIEQLWHHEWDEENDED